MQRLSSALGGVYVEWRIKNGSHDLNMTYGKTFFPARVTEKTFLIGITDDQVIYCIIVRCHCHRHLNTNGHPNRKQCKIMCRLTTVLLCGVQVGHPNRKPCKIMYRLTIVLLCGVQVGHPNRKPCKIMCRLTIVLLCGVQVGHPLVFRCPCHHRYLVKFVVPSNFLR